VGFDLFAFLTTILGGINVNEIGTELTTWLNTKGKEYPDLQSRTDALATWLQKTLGEIAPELDPATMANTIKGIAADIVHGTAGVDPGAFHGGG